MTLVSTVGGASGPLFGTLFLRIGSTLGDAETVSAPERRRRAAGRARWRRGPRQGRPGGQDDVRRAGAGRRRAGGALTDGADLAAALKHARDAAAAGRDATTPMLARKGRASYLGERSVGHQDPGATTVALLLEAATQAPF